MKALIAVISLLIVSFQISGCASSSKNTRVVETEDGQLHSVATADEEADAAMKAIDSASNFCEKKKQTAVFAAEELNEKPTTEQTAQKRIEGIIRKLPVVGKTLSPDEKARVAVSFRCK